MTVILDNLTAVVVGTTLLVSLLFVQQRGQQSAVEASTRYQAQQTTSTFAATIERDVENIRTRAQSDSAFAGGATTYRFTLRRGAGPDGATYTRQFTFPTLQNPSLGLASPIVIVTYHLEPTGETLRIGGDDRPVFQATRYVYERGGSVTSTGTLGGIVDFDVTAYGETGARILEAEVVDPTPPRVHIDVFTAVDIPDHRTSDQKGGDTFVATRHARTVRVVGANATGAPPVDESERGGIPALPGDADYDG